MQQQIFTDGIGKISVIGGVVRLDFMVYAPADPDAPAGALHGQPRQIFTHQVLMGVDAFTRAAGQCADAVKQIQAAGQPAPQPQPAPKPAPAPQAMPPAAPQPPVQSMPAAPAEAAPQRKPESSPWTANLKPVAPMRPFP
jgi:hypothetical protein